LADRGIRSAVHLPAAKVNAKPSAFPTFGSSDHSGRPHIECRLIFSRNEELIALLDDGRAERLAAEYEAVLKEHAFDDLALERATLCGQLRAAGHPESEASRLASEQYPLPSRLGA
jgi:hypothetical protein